MNAWLKRFGFARALAALLIAIVLVTSIPIPCQANVREPFCACEERTVFLPDGIFFFGESTTAHLTRHGGVLDCDTYRTRVLRDQSGTRRLDRRILSSPVLLQKGGGEQSVSLLEAVIELQPRVLILSFGLNGLLQFAQTPERFIADYRALTEGIHNASPDTRILLQSIYPIAENKVYSIDLSTANQLIQMLNQRIEFLTKEQDYLRFANTATLLRDEDGALLADCNNGDGIHLTNHAYHLLLAALLAELQTWDAEVAE